MAKEPQEKEEGGTAEATGKKGFVGNLLGKITSPFKALFGKIFGNKKILIAAVAVLVLLLGGVGYLMFAGGGHEEAKQEAIKGEEHKDTAHGEKEGGPAGEEAIANLPHFVDLPEMTINLVSATGKLQFLRVKVTLEVPNAETAKQIEPVMPRILDVFQVYMRELRVADIEGSAGIQRLKEELTKRVNQVATPSHVDGVLFKDMLVQ